MSNSFESSYIDQSSEECVFTLPKDYGYVIIATGLVGLLCILQGMLLVGGRRKKFFSPEFMKQFEITHYQHYSSDVTKSGGYPDMGNGYYSQKLPYNEWREFNQAQRVHYNFLEQITPVMFFILATGLKYPWVAVSIGICKFVARILVIGYVSDQGAKNIFRVMGAILGDLVFLGGFVMMFISGLKVSCVF